MTKAFHIVAQNIKTGGGKELLIYLLDYLSEHHYNLKVIAYIDGSLSDIKNEKETKNIKILLFNSISSKVKVHLKKISFRPLAQFYRKKFQINTTRTSS